MEVSQTTPYGNSPKSRKSYLSGYEIGHAIGSRGEEITCPHDLGPQDEQEPFAEGFYAGQFDGLMEFKKGQ